MTSFPFNSPEARTRGAEMVTRGYDLERGRTPATSASPECPLDDMLMDIGKFGAMQDKELSEAHALIPESIAPFKEATLGERTTLAERLAVYIEHLKAHG